MSLPSGYRQLEYIQSTGTQYIDTGIIETNDTAINCKFNIDTAANDYLFGSQQNLDYMAYNGFYYNNVLEYNYQEIAISASDSIEIQQKVEGSTNTIVINGTSYSAEIGTCQNSSLLIFAIRYKSDVQNGSVRVYSGSAKVYYFQIVQGGNLVFDGIPCINASGEVGLYDLVGKQFYGNAGTGVFVGGGYTSLKTGDILNYVYTGAVQFVTLPKGVYKLEVWGAQGGSYSSYYGGAGGYSVGVLTLTANTTKLFVYVGGQPTTSSSSSVTIEGGFNGGGKARYHSYSDTTTYCQAGGGGSDIRIGTDSLYARVIVAGGGGGSASVNAKTTKYGGGTSGGSPQSGYAASQTSAGTNGSFGVGADGYISGYNYKYASGGGGGGWYGGGAINKQSDSTNYRGYNGGGSGFVWTGSNAPSGYLLGPECYLTDASTIAGNASMPSTSGGTETGHTGHGYARITAIKVDSLNLPVNIGGTWKEANEAFVNIGGTWKTVEAAFVNIDGTWKELG